MRTYRYSSDGARVEYSSDSEHASLNDLKHFSMLVDELFEPESVTEKAKAINNKQAWLDFAARSSEFLKDPRPGMSAKERWLKNISATVIVPHWEAVEIEDGWTVRGSEPTKDCKIDSSYLIGRIPNAPNWSITDCEALAKARAEFLNKQERKDASVPNL